MESSDKELAEKLIDAGNKLLPPSSSLENLLDQLDILESYLSKVQQAPPQPLQDAIVPSTKALVAKELLKHSETDVKVSVASCVNEVIRIAAPDAPYTDDEMKECFKLTVYTLKKLSNVPNRNYSKAIRILETIAKVRSCLVMLDLECDSMILEMFKIFLKHIRYTHPRGVFENMERIMTLIIEESEDIPWELLSLLLDSVKIKNKKNVPMTFKLGEKVIHNCGGKLGFYIKKAVEAIGIDLNDYAQTVSTVCQNAPDDPEDEEDQEMVVSEPPPDSKCQEVIGASSDGNKDTVQAKEKEKDASAVRISLKAKDIGSSKDQISLKVKENDARKGQISLKIKETDARKDQISLKAKDIGSSKDQISVKTKENDACKDQISSKAKDIGSSTDQISLKTKEKDASKDQISLKIKDNEAPEDQNSSKADENGKPETVKTEAGPETIPKKRCWKPNSKMNPDEGYEHIWLCGNRKREPKLPNVQKKDDTTDKGIIDNSPAETPVFKEPAVPALDGKNFTPGSSSSRKRKIPEDHQSKKDKCPKKGGKDSPLIQNESMLSLQVEVDVDNPKLKVKSEKEDTDNLAGKSPIRSTKKSSPPNTSGSITLASGHTVIKEEIESNYDEKSIFQTLMNTIPPNVNDFDSSIQSIVDKEKGKGKEVVIEEFPEKKKMVGSSAKASRKKRKPKMEEDSRTPKSSKNFDERLVGSKIKVWWPQDKAFYEGIIYSYDHNKRKHMVLYDDGETELLNLVKQRWELIKDDYVPDEVSSSQEKVISPASEEASLDGLQKEGKLKTMKDDFGSWSKRHENENESETGGHKGLSEELDARASSKENGKNENGDMSD